MNTAKPVSEDTCSQLESLYSEAKSKLEDASSSSALEAIRVEYLGKKGKFASILAQLKDFSPDQRKVVGQTANRIKSEFESQLNSRMQKIKNEELEKSLREDDLDASLPGVHFTKGAIHPVRWTLNRAIEILEKAGLTPVYGPEVEFESYNFDRLNFKKGHAARDMQATFFVDRTEGQENLVLRTHTSPVQVRVLLDLAKKNFPTPVRIQAPGRVYRVDDDATHSPMFHQVEGLVVDKYSGMGDLRAVLDFFCRKFFDEQTKVRFRPSYFPFTEPSAEVDISCVFCGGEGCKVCKGSGWLEVGGAGLVHPEVFRECGWDPDEYQGWAFGLGIERLAMLKLRVPDIRSFFENRLSLLRGEVQSDANQS